MKSLARLAIVWWLVIDSSGMAVIPYSYSSEAACNKAAKYAYKAFCIPSEDEL